MQETPSPAEPAGSAATSGNRIVWFLRGTAHVASVPAMILASSFIGFAALAIESGLTAPQAVFMTGIVWALPGKVVLVGAVIGGNGLLATAFAVALTSARLTPMVVAIVPELRSEKTRTVTLYLLSHFVAITSWVIAMERLPSVPVRMRTAWYAGLGSSLIFLTMAVVAIVYVIAEDLPATISAALFLLTPMYFLTSMWGSARERASHIAMVLGLFLGPVFAVIVPEFSLFATGMTGGLLAYGYHRLARRRKLA